MELPNQIYFTVSLHEMNDFLCDINSKMTLVDYFIAPAGS